MKIETVVIASLSIAVVALCSVVVVQNTNHPTANVEYRQAPTSVPPVGLVPPSTAPASNVSREYRRDVPSVQNRPSQQPNSTPPDLPAQTAYPSINVADIADYLQFVRSIEERKVALMKQELSEALVSRTRQMEQEREAQNSNQHNREWDNLASSFATRTPPQSCVQLRDAYYTHLETIQRMFTRRSVTPQDDNATRIAENALLDLCQKYSLRKEFTISTDPR